MFSGPKRILLVEPEAVLAELTAFRLELLGYYVDQVGSAEDALASIESNPPDLIITDLVLPTMPAMAFIERVASQHETSNIPVMVFSFDADLDKVQAVHQAGGRDFLVVPFQPEILEEKVRRLLKQAEEFSKQRILAD